MENIICVKEHNKNFHCFVSHRGVDKPDFVIPLVDRLEKLGFAVWCDSNNIDLGDHIDEAIDNGLMHSRYIIIIVSPSYIEGYWTKMEYRTALQVESCAGHEVLIPVWHNVSYQDVMQFSPILASRLAIKADDLSIGDVAIELAARMNAT